MKDRRKQAERKNPLQSFMEFRKFNHMSESTGHYAEPTLRLRRPKLTIRAG